MSEGQKRRFKDNPMSEEDKEWRRKLSSGKNNPYYGKKHSDEIRKKCSEGAKKQWKRKLVWINNGEINKRVEVHNIPEGFVLGRTINKVKCE